ncbi:MAG TPA: RNA methyltransferase [Myxococcaceae bacterium]|nr:RNA methyltransferase [Myxococcaceae bacterium]
MPTPVRFVLVHPRTPENLGSAARALKNFGQFEWTWVRPPWSPDDPRTRTLAVGAEDVLASARLASSLDDAVSDCSWVVGTSGRARLRPLPMDPETFAAEAARRSGRVALVFGDERTGLRREELARCHGLTRIPSDARQPSLNLAQAVCIYAHALFRPAERRVGRGPRPGTDAELRRLEGALAEVLRTAGFVRPGRAGVSPLVVPWRRSGLTRTEIQLWESAIRTLARSLTKI